MTTKTEAAQRLARAIRVRARQAHARGATGTKVNRLFVGEVAHALGMHDLDQRTARTAHRIAVEELRATHEEHLIDLADAPGARPTGRQRIDAVAAEHGWTAHRDHWALELWVYRKKRDYIRVYYTHTGRVVEVHTSRWGVGQHGHGKAEIVLGYLRGNKASPLAGGENGAARTAAGADRRRGGSAPDRHSRPRRRVDSPEAS